VSRRSISIVLVLVALQVAALAVWLVVEGAREPDGPLAAERLSGSAPSVQLEYFDGTTSSLEDFRGCPVLLHFWASWCSPCREELPAVLSVDVQRLVVIAAAIDDTWPAMRQLTDTRSRRIARISDRMGSNALTVRELPVTFLIDSEGNLVERYQGARDWDSDSARARLERFAGSGPGCPGPAAPP